MIADTAGWAGDGALTGRVISAVQEMPQVVFLKVEDAPASRSDAGFSFISNELFVGFAAIRTVRWTRRLGLLPWRIVSHTPLMTLPELEARLAAIEDIGPPDYSDEGMLQYLRSERIIPAYQTRGYKLVELLRIYAAGEPRRPIPETRAPSDDPSTQLR